MSIRIRKITSVLLTTSVITQSIAPTLSMDAPVSKPNQQDQKLSTSKISRADYDQELDFAASLSLSDDNALFNKTNKDVNDNVGQLFSLLPDHQRYISSFKPIWELSEHFGYQFWKDQDNRGKDVITLVNDCDQSNRLDLIKVLNDLFWPTRGTDLNDRKLRGYFINSFHMLYKNDRIQKIRMMIPLIHMMIDDYKDAWECYKLIDRLSELGKKWSINQLDTYINQLTALLKQVKPIDGPWSIFCSMQTAVEIDPTGKDIQKIIPLIIPFLIESKKIDWKKSEIIVEALNVIKAEGDEDAISHCLIFKDLREVPDIINSVSKVQSGQREAFIRSIADMQVKLKMGSDSVSQLAKDLSILDIEKRKLVLDRIIHISTHKKIYNFYGIVPLLAKMTIEEYGINLPHALTITSNYSICDALEIVNKIPIEIRGTVCQRYAELIKQRSQKTKDHLSSFGDSKEALISTIAEFSSDEWETALPAIVTLAAATSYPSFIAGILNTLKSVPKDRLEEVYISLEKLKPLMSHDLNVYAITAGLTADEIIEIPEIIDAMLEGLSTEDKAKSVVGDMLDDAARIKAKDRLISLRIAVPYLKDIKDANSRSRFFEGLLGIRKTELERILQQSFGILKRLEKNHINLTRYLDKIPADDLPYVIQLLESWTEEFYDGMHFENLIQTITKYNGKELKELVDLLQRHMPLIKNLDTKIDLFKAFGAIDQEQRGNVLSLCSPVFEKFDYGHSAFVLNVSKIPEDERSMYLEKTRKLLNTSSDGFLFADILDVLYSMDRFDTKINSQCVDKYIKFITSIEPHVTSLINLNPREPKSTPREAIERHKIRTYFMSVLGALPLDILDKCIKSLTHLRNSDPIHFNDIYTFPTEVISYLKSINIIDMELLVTQWSDFLRTNPNKTRVKHLTDYITKYAHWFALMEHDEIVQQAIRTGINLNNSNDPLNPYKVYERLKSKHNETVNWAEIKPTTEVLSGLTVHFNPLFLKDDLPQYGLTISTLPPYTPTSLNDFIVSMNARVRHEPIIESKIKEITACKFNELKSASLADGILQRLLTTYLAPDTCVPVVTSRFIAIVSYLETLSNERDKEDIFSPKEEGFLRMLASIQGCPNGKSEGINSYYFNILPAKYRYTPIIASGDENVGYLKSKSAVSAILLEEVEKMFSGQNHLMKTIVGIDTKEEVIQASHQAGYLRNLLNHMVGLPKSISFDAHTQTLYVRLLNLSTQDALNVFFKFFVPSQFIYRIMDKYDLEELDAIDLLADMGILSIKK